MREARLLIVEEAEDFLRSHFEQKGYEVEVAATLAEAREKLSGKIYDLALCGWTLPDGEGSVLLGEVRESHPHTRVVVTSDGPSSVVALEALKLGAYNYLAKPFQVETLDAVVAGALTRDEPPEPAPVPEPDFRPEELVGRSSRMLAILPLVERAAKESSAVLIQGEPGTGKELVARTIHRSGVRREKPFLAVDGSAFSEEKLESELFGHVKGAAPFAKRPKMGLFQKADEGTLYLTRIDALAPALQVKLRRALKEGRARRLGGRRQERFDVQVIASSERDLWERAEAGAFHEELCRRLSDVMIDLPPLRERLGDVEFLAEHFLRRYGGAARPLSGQALHLLESYDWPGNVDELEAAVETAMKRTRTENLLPRDFPVYARLRPSRGFVPSALRADSLLRHLLQLEEHPSCPPSFGAAGLEAFLWAGGERSFENLKAFEPLPEKAQAARRLATALERARLDPDDLLDDPDGLARYLFLEHAEIDAAVTGVVALSQRGGWGRVEVLHRGNLAVARLGARSVLAPAFEEGGALLLFHLHPGGVAPGAAEKELTREMARAAEVVGVDFLDSWWMSGPSSWSSLFPEGRGACRPARPAEGPVFRSRPRNEEVSLADLGEVLELRAPRGRREWLLEEEERSVYRSKEMAAEVLRVLGSVGLARVDPDELSFPPLPAASVRALACALELARRVGRLALCPRPMVGTPEYLARQTFLYDSWSEGVDVLLLDEEGRAKDLRGREKRPADSSLRRRIAELVVAEEARVVVPVVRRAGSPKPSDTSDPGLIPSLAEESGFLDLVVSPPLVLYEDGSWFCSAQRGKVEQKWGP